jgi:hypothetical protein
MTAIMNHQHEFFITGDETSLRPMILKDIAERTGLDISTVSRVANSKFVQTEFGTYRLKFFFSESLTTDSGEEVSTREVKKILSDLIEGEHKKKPLSDERLDRVIAGKRLQHCPENSSQIQGTAEHSRSQVAKRTVRFYSHPGTTAGKDKTVLKSTDFAAVVPGLLF